MLEVVKQFHDINNGSLIKMGFVKVNDSSVTKDDVNAITRIHDSLTFLGAT